MNHRQDDTQYKANKVRLISSLTVDGSDPELDSSRVKDDPVPGTRKLQVDDAK